VPGTRWRRLRRAALRFSVIYCLVAIVLSGCADSLILHPTTDPIAGVPAQQMKVAGPQGIVEIWKMRSAGAAHHEPVAFAMTFVGNASRAEYDVEIVAELWGDRPVEVWAVNYPGYGGSAGDAKLKFIAPAALAAYDAMKKQAGSRPTFVGGRSLGTTAALYVAAHRPVSGTILHSPPALRNLIIGRFGWWNLWLAAVPVALQVPRDLDSIQNAQHVTAPGVFLITGADTYVPPSNQQKVSKAYAGAKQIIVMPDTDHNDPMAPASMKPFQASLDWLLEMSGVTPVGPSNESGLQKK